jgi:serine/threonine protein kinase
VAARATCAPAADYIVKVARTNTEDVRLSFQREKEALAILRDSLLDEGLIPELRGVGTRNGCSWPLLVLRPRGLQLVEWVSKRVAGGGTRKSCASEAITRVLRALGRAHDKNLVHCDVRPSNIVVVEDKAMLADWGSSRAVDDKAAGCGVAAYASAKVFEQTSYPARPLQDIAGALFTWIAIAFSDSCTAPWLGGRDYSEVFAARSNWILKEKKTHSELAAVASIIAEIEASHVKHIPDLLEDAIAAVS